MSLHDKLEELHKLHLACVELDHGIYQRNKWILFEQTKFIYAYFTFTSIYSINWDSSFSKQELVEWGLINEEDKIDELVMFCFGNLGHKGMDDFYHIMKNLIPTGINHPLKEMEDIMTDLSASSKIKDFQRDFKFIYSQEYVNVKKLSKKRNVLKDVLYFIYLIRNSIFHGTKTVTHMLNIGQQRRLSIYTAVLISVNELLFKVAENRLSWVREGYSHTRKSLDTETFQERFKIQVPGGCLYYPCCGGDLFVPIRLFKDTINEFHFVDIDPIILAHNEEKSSRFSNNIFPTNEVVQHTSHDVEVLKQDLFHKMIDDLKVISDNINMPKVIYIKKDTWEVEVNKVVRKVHIYRHKMDALLTLQGIEKIAVFYYYGDSQEEGGSGQWWLGPKIMNMVLERLVDGGIIVTDGSNPDPNRTQSGNKQLWEHPRKLKNNPLVYTTKFEYNGREFIPIGELRQRSRPTYAWQVKRLKIYKEKEIN